MDRMVESRNDRRILKGMDNYNYPIGADTSEAPWNQVDELPYKEVEVTISVSLSKTVKVRVNDYTVEYKDYEEGWFPSYDFSKCNITEAVKEQVVLPQNLAEYTEIMFNHDLNLKAAGMPKYLKDAIADCKGWTVDDMECILE